MGDEKQAMVPGSLLQFRLPTGGITTRFYHPNPARLAKCVSCGVFPESLLKLQCSHHLCEVCVMSTRSYTCDIDSTTTEIQRPLTVPLTHNAAIKDAAVLCPGCSAFIHFGKIKGHIYKDHPKLLLQASPRPLVDNQAAVPPGGPYGTPLGGSRQAAALRHQGNESRGGASVWGAAVSPGGPYGNTMDGSGQALALEHQGHESNGGTSAWGAPVPPGGPYGTPLDRSRQAAALRHQGNESRGDASAWGAAVSPREPYGNTIDGSGQAPALQHKGHESNGGTSAWGAAVPPAGPYGKTIDGSRQAPALKHRGHESHGGTSAWGAAVPPAGQYGTTSDGSRLAAALQHQGHESHGGTSAWGAAVPPGGPHGNTLDGSRQAPALQHHGHESHGGASVGGHTGKNDEPAAPKDSADVDMEDADSCAQLPTRTFIADHQEQSTNVSNTLACKYCLKAYQVGKHEEHQNTCLVLFARGWKFFSSEIFKQYYQHVSGVTQGSKQNIKTIEDHMKDGLFRSQEFMMLLRFLVTECFEKHLNKHCQGEPDVPTDIEEHTRTCPTFNSKCIDFWTQVLFGYEKPEDNIGCPTKEQDGESFQKKAVGGSSQYMDDEERRGGNEKRSNSEECPYCSEAWNPEEFFDHLRSCEEQFINCPECELRVHKDSYKEHLNQKCLRKDRVDNHAETAPKSNGKEAGKQDGVEDLKEKVKDLEKRIKALEDPLIRLIRKLKEEEKK
ncbi:uncharacterized protein LOC144142804 isoform X2 [Haemaphysalis longicornis]